MILTYFLMSNILNCSISEQWELAQTCEISICRFTNILISKVPMIIKLQICLHCTAPAVESCYVVRRGRELRPNRWRAALDMMTLLSSLLRSTVWATVADAADISAICIDPLSWLAASKMLLIIHVATSTTLKEATARWLENAEWDRVMRMKSDQNT